MSARPTREWVAIILAAGLVVAVNTLTVAVLLEALTDHPDSPLSQNATQLLTAAFGGIVAVLGSYVGYMAATVRGRREKKEVPPGPTA